jgi:hypothetical protein
VSTLSPARSETRLLAGAGTAALLVVLLLTLAGAPTAVRALICLPLLVGISGAAISASLVPQQDRLDGLTRGGLALLFGLASLLFSGLLVALILRHGLGTRRLVVVQVLVSALALATFAASRFRRVPVPPPAGTVPAPRTSTIWSAVAGIVLLGLALVGGRLLLPGDSAAPTFSFTGPAATAAGPTKVAPAGPITLDWALRHAGTLPKGQPLQAVIDGQSVDVRSNVTPVTGGDYGGQASLVAPSTPGLHRVVLSIPLPSQRLELVTYVDVQPA